MTKLSPMGRFVGVFLLLFGLVFGGVGGFMAWKQQRMIATFLPTDADILETHVETKQDGDDSPTFLPVATFRYTVNGQAYTGKKVFPTEVSAGSAWARGIINRIQVLDAAAARDKSHVPAYYNPRAPAESFLLAEYTCFPYIFLIPGLAIATAGAGLLSGLLGRTVRPIAVALDTSGWQLVMPRDSLRQRLRTSLKVFATIAIVLGLPLFHWTVIACQMGLFGEILGAVTLLALAFPAWSIFSRWNASRFLGDPRVLIRPWPLQRGQPVELQIEADARRSLDIVEAHARFLCTEHYREGRGDEAKQGTRKRFDRTVPLAEASRITEGNTLEARGIFLCTQEEAPGTSDISMKKVYPWYTWEMHLEITPRHAPAFKSAFPLRVE